MVFLADARTDPRTVVVELPHTLTTVVTMFSPILFPDIADTTVVMLVPLIQKQLVLFERVIFETWVSARRQH